MLNLNINSLRLNFFLIFAVCLLIIAKIYSLQSTEFDLDILNKQLKPLQKFIKPNSKIGCMVNNNDLFMPVQYVMAPQVISNNSNCDTLLLVQDKTKPMQAFNNYRIIAQQQTNYRLVSLITKIK